MECYETCSGFGPDSDAGVVDSRFEVFSVGLGRRADSKFALVELKPRTDEASDDGFDHTCHTKISNNP